MVSIIIPVYNAEKWINRCIDSLIAQTVFEQIELIIIDDGSKDNSGTIIDEYVNKYNNIFCRHIKNGGVSNARNIGLDIAVGDYITFVDADDYFDSKMIENLLRAMDQDCDITCSGFIAEYPDRSVQRCSDKEYSFDNKEAIHQFLLGGVLEPNVTDKLFRKSIIGAQKFDTRIAIAEDKYFLFQCLKKAKSIKLISVANYHYVMNDSSACRKDFSPEKFHSTYVADEICKEIECIYPEYKDLADSMAIDVKCRVYGDMYRYKVKEQYISHYNELRKDIKKFSVIKKYKLSNKKHFLAFIAAKVHPGLYCFLKNDMKLQYKNNLN